MAFSEVAASALTSVTEIWHWFRFHSYIVRPEFSGSVVWYGSTHNPLTVSNNDDENTFFIMAYLMMKRVYLNGRVHMPMSSPSLKLIGGRVGSLSVCRPGISLVPPQTWRSFSQIFFLDKSNSRMPSLRRHASLSSTLIFNIFDQGSIYLKIKEAMNLLPKQNTSHLISCIARVRAQAGGLKKDLAIPMKTMKRSCFSMLTPILNPVPSHQNKSSSAAWLTGGCSIANKSHSEEDAGTFLTAIFDAFYYPRPLCPLESSGWSLSPNVLSNLQA